MSGFPISVIASFKKKITKMGLFFNPSPSYSPPPKYLVGTLWKSLLLHMFQSFHSEGIGYFSIGQTPYLLEFMLCLPWLLVTGSPRCVSAVHTRQSTLFLPFEGFLGSLNCSLANMLAFWCVILFQYSSRGLWIPQSCSSHLWLHILLLQPDPGSHFCLLVAATCGSWKLLAPDTHPASG